MNSSDEIIDMVEAYADQVHIDFEKSVIEWQIDLSQENVHYVFGGLLSRQCILGTELIKEPLLWNYIMSPLILRAMSELIINMAWISLDPLARADEFVAYGLGQSKLGLEHARNLESLFLEEKKAVDAQALWLNSQRHEIFADVNVGLWTDKDLETMAQESNAYGSFVLYSSLTGAAHGTWDHNFQVYLNGLDESAKPILPNPSFQPYSIIVAAQLVDEAFHIFRVVAGQSHDSATYKQLIANMNKFRKS